MFLPVGDLVDTAAGILIQRNIEPVDEFGVLALDVEGIVLCVVLTGLGAVVTQLVDVVEADHVPMLALGILLSGAAADLGIQVIAILVLDLQQPTHVVDAGDQFPAALQLIFHAQMGQQAMGAALNTVAQANGADTGVAEHIAGDEYIYL